MKVKTKTFGIGGIVIDKWKFTASSPLIKTHVPIQVRLPMCQDSGKPARTLVAPGEHVEEGQIIGEAPDNDSAHIHTSVSGKVISVERGSGFGKTETDIVTVATGGTIKNWYGRKYDTDDLAPEQMISEIRQAGIVEMDGGLDCWPAQTNLSLKEGKKADILIVDTVESVPYISAGHRILLEKTAEVIEGIRLVMKITGAGEAIIAIDEDKADVAGIISFGLIGLKDMRVEILKSRYPQGCERELIYALLKKELPAGKVPRDLGIVVENTATILAIYEALVFKKPLIERYITYTGDKIEKRGNYKVKIGTPVRLLAEEFGMPGTFGAVIAGDPLTGMEITDMNTPVMKGTSGIVFLPKYMNYKVLDRPCIRCSRCLSSCPMRLNPAVLADISREENFSESFSLGLSQCTECGCCSYICPSSIPITALIRYGKKVLLQKGRNYNGRN